MAPDLHFSVYPAEAAARALVLRPGVLRWFGGRGDRLAIRFCFRPKEKLDIGLWWNSEARQPDVRLICGLYPDWVEFGSLLGNGFDQPALQGRGFGTLAVQSVFNLDPPMIMGTVLFSAVLVVGANWVVDLLYRWIDPRIKSAS